MRLFFTLVTLLALVIVGCVPPKTEDDNTFSRGLTFTDPDVYGAVPLYQPAVTFGAGGLPDRIDLTESGRFPDPGDQGRQQSCTAWACAYALKTYQEATERNNTPTSLGQVFSPAFPYYFTNRAQGDTQRCVGAAVTTIKTVMDLLKTRGAATLATMGYDPAVCAVPPSDAALNEAKNYVIRDYARLSTKEEIRRALSEGHPVVIGLMVGSTFEAAWGPMWTAADYQADLYDPTGGGHAFLIVGYDDAARTFKVMNSWTMSWGDGGFWQISYDVIDLAGQLLAQGQTAFELWMAWDNVTEEAFEPTPVVDETPPDSAGESIAISNILFGVDAVDPETGLEGLDVIFDLDLEPGLSGDEITLVLTVIDTAAEEVLLDRDGQYSYDGYVAQMGTIYVADVFSFGQLTMFLPYDAFDLDSGSYVLTPALLGGNRGGSQVVAAVGDGTFTLNLLLPQVNTSIPVGDYTGVDSDGWLVDFFVEGDGSVFAGLSHPTEPYFFEAVSSGLTEDGSVHMQFAIDDFVGGVTCEYLGGFTYEGGGEGIWACNNGWEGTWEFESWDMFVDFDDYDNFSDWTGDFVSLDEDQEYDNFDNFDEYFDEQWADYWEGQDFDWEDFNDFGDFDDYWSDAEWWSDSNGYADFWGYWEDGWYDGGY